MKNLLYKQLEICHNSGKVALNWYSEDEKGVEFVWRLYFLPNEKWSIIKRLKWEWSKKFRETYSDDISFTINGKLRMLMMNRTTKQVTSLEFREYIQNQLRSELSESLNVVYFDMFNFISIKE